MNTLLISVPFILIIGALLISRSKARLFTDPEKEDEERAARAAAYDVARTEWKKGQSTMLVPRDSDMKEIVIDLKNMMLAAAFGIDWLIAKLKWPRPLAYYSPSFTPIPINRIKPDYSMYWPTTAPALTQPYQSVI